MRSIRFAIFGGLVLLAGQASGETITYSYDALGRLTASSVDGGPNGGTNTATTFDAAGNRSSYSVSGRTTARDASPLEPRTLLASKSVRQRSSTL